MKRLLALVVVCAAALLAQPPSSNARRLQGRAVCSTAPSDTNALVWSASGACWTPGSPGAAVGAPPTGAAGGKLSGTYPNPGVNLLATDVPFTQTGTGAVARTVDSALKDHLSAKDFGAAGTTTTTTTVGTTSVGTSVTLTSASTFAVGNGLTIAGAGAGGALYVGAITVLVGAVATISPATETEVAAGAVVSHDDTAALQAAIDVTSTAQSELFLPAGAYPITTVLNVHFNTRIRGTGWTFGSRIVPSGCAALKIDGDTEAGGYNFRSTVSDLTIDLSESTAGLNYVYLNKAYQVQLNRVWIYNTPDVASSIGLKITDSNNIQINGLVVSTADSNYPVCVSVTGASNVNLLAPDLEHCNVGLKVADSSVVTVSGMYMERNVTNVRNDAGNLGGLTINGGIMYIPNSGSDGIYNGGTNLSLNGVHCKGLNSAGAARCVAVGAYSGTFFYEDVDAVTSTSYASFPATVTRTIASGSTAMGTAEIGENATATLVQAVATGVLTTDVVSFSPNAPLSGVTGYTPAGTLAIVAYPGIGLLSGTYTSGITATGTVGQTCALSSFNGAGAGATATVALTDTDTIAGGTALVVVTNGVGFTSAPTSATAGNGTATCSGTATVATATSGYVNFDVMNKDQVNHVTPGAVTLNWRVTR